MIRFYNLYVQTFEKGKQKFKLMAFRKKSERSHAEDHEAFSALSESKQVIASGHKSKLSKKKFLETFIQIQEEERKRLGQELHDSVNSSLTIAKFYLGLLPAGTEKEQFAKDQLSFIISTTEQCIRTISCNMVISQETDSDLIKLVSNLVTRINGLNIFPVAFKHNKNKQLDRLPGYKKIILYRIVQEQLNNIIKYSKATEAHISITASKASIKIMIKDNGIGFEMSEQADGIGLSNISDRAKQLNGRAEIRSEPGKGFQIDIIIPAKE